jgi:very-short-patch-repair endonuclease
VGHVAPSPQREWMTAVIASRREPGKLGPDETGGEPKRPTSAHDADDAASLAAAEADTILSYWGAALSHRSAAELWALLPARQGVIDVSILGYGGKKRRAGIRLHRSLSLLPAHVTLRNGIPVTNPARTIADLRRVVSKPGRSRLISPRDLRRAIRQAEVLGLPLGDEIEGDRTRSDLERDFLRLCRRHGLPAPEVNVRVGPHLVDFLWRDRQFVVETDGYAYHRGRAAFEDDRERDLGLRARGFEVIRLAEKQVDEEPGRVAEVLAAALRVGADAHESQARSQTDE